MAVDIDFMKILLLDPLTIPFSRLILNFKQLFVVASLRVQGIKQIKEESVETRH